MDKIEVKELTVDIETAPFKAWTFHLGEQIIRHDHLVDSESYINIICICYKWRHEKKVHTITWDKYQNTEKMIAEFDKIAAQADIIIGQNSDRFDIKHINTHRMINGLPPLPAWFHMTFADTMKLARKYFNLPSTSLDYVSKHILKRGGKKKMELADWIKILEGTQKEYKQYMKKMVTYCKKDVVDTELWYNKMRDYIKPFINKARANNTKLGCIHCGSTNLATLRKAYSNTQVYQEWSCKDCKKYACRTPIRIDGVVSKTGRM